MANNHCSVPLCTNDKRNESGRSFFNFPNHVDIKKKWIAAIRRDESDQFKVGHFSLFTKV